MLYAEEQWAEDQRRRANAVSRREQPVGEQLLMDDGNDEGVDVAAEDHVVVEGGDNEGGGADVEGVVNDGVVEDDAAENDEGYDSFIEERSRPATPQPDPTVVCGAEG